MESWEDKCARRTMRDDGELILQNLINNKHVPGPATGDTSWWETWGWQNDRRTSGLSEIYNLCPQLWDKKEDLTYKNPWSPLCIYLVLWLLTVHIIVSFNKCKGGVVWVVTFLLSTHKTGVQTSRNVFFALISHPPPCIFQMVLQFMVKVQVSFQVSAPWGIKIIPKPGASIYTSRAVFQSDGLFSLLRI